MAASVQETMQRINAACRAKGGKFAEYSCKVVSWDDVSRGTVGGSLSCWGANITDTYLKSRTGEQLFTVRSDNWNEKLGRVSASEVALVAGEDGPRGPVRPVTLRSVLKELGRYGGYAGLSSRTDLSNDRLDTQCSIRFQTTFLPVSGARGAMEFATEAYNYNTTSDSDPRNLVLMCTTQGMAVQQDGAGAKRLLHHAVDEAGTIHRYWLEAERSRHQVGGPQRETAEERADALERGKATASVIGTRAMGQRFNVLMTIQVPLQQQQRPPRRTSGGFWPSLSLASSTMLFGAGAGSVPYAAASGAGDMGDMDFMESACESECLSQLTCQSAKLESASASFRRRSCSTSAVAPRTGVANAARVSRGSEEDTWPGLSVRDPKRNSSEHVTITVVIYNTVADGVPSEADVLAAIDDLEELYQACNASGRLADQLFDFMKAPLTTKDKVSIAEKITTQPYVPPPTQVINHDAFPVDR